MTKDLFTTRMKSDAKSWKPVLRLVLSLKNSTIKSDWRHCECNSISTYTVELEMLSLWPWKYRVLVLGGAARDHTVKHVASTLFQATSMALMYNCSFLCVFFSCTVCSGDYVVAHQSSVSLPRSEEYMWNTLCCGVMGGGWCLKTQRTAEEVKPPAIWFSYTASGANNLRAVPRLYFRRCTPKQSPGWAKISSVWRIGTCTQKCPRELNSLVVKLLQIPAPRQPQKPCLGGSPAWLQPHPPSSKP